MSGSGSLGSSLLGVSGRLLRMVTTSASRMSRMNIVIVRILRVVYNVFMLYFFVNGK